jgi:hypothetical protein
MAEFCGLPVATTHINPGNAGTMETGGQGVYWLRVLSNRRNWLKATAGMGFARIARIG